MAVCEVSSSVPEDVSINSAENSMAIKGVTKIRTGPMNRTQTNSMTKPHTLKLCVGSLRLAPYMYIELFGFAIHWSLQSVREIDQKIVKTHTHLSLYIGLFSPVWSEF